MKGKIINRLAVIYVSLMTYIVLISFTVRELVVNHLTFKGVFLLIGSLLLSVITLALIRDLVNISDKFRNNKQMYKLEKISDDVFNGDHPNGIVEGMTWVGRFLLEPTVGEVFIFFCCDPSNVLETSTVIEVGRNVFKTRNSTYKLIKIKD